MILGIHGVGYQRLNAATETPKWQAALARGLDAAGSDPQLAQKLRLQFYGDLFVTQGTRDGPDPPYGSSDVEPGFETELLELWKREAQRTDRGVPPSGAPTRLPYTPVGIQDTLDLLSNSSFFAGIAERALIFDLKQVRQYMTDETTRRPIQQRVAEGLTPETRIIISHSLGTVVAYELLCAHPDCCIHGLVTMGSPLGIPNLIFEKLIPAPQQGLGLWPPSLKCWVNVADSGDLVALEKHLAPRFGHRVEDQEVGNGIAEVHGAEK
jgi:hypothetical protein